MPYSRITHTKHYAAALKYAEGNGKGHNGKADRNLLVGAVGLYPAELRSYKEQFAELLAKRSEQNKTDVRRMIISYSKKELTPNDPASAVKALEIAQEIADKYYKGFPTAIYVQADGKGGCLHTHLITCNVNAITHKGFSSEQTCHSYLRNAVDEIAPQYITHDQSEAARNKVTQAERNTKGYIWKDDLKQRIKRAMQGAYSREDYIKRLKNEGVAATFKTSKKQGEYILYELTDTSKFKGDIPSNLKSKSYKLGSDFGISLLDEKIAHRQHIKQLAAAFSSKPQEQKQEQPEKFSVSPLEAPTKPRKRNGKIQVPSTTERHTEPPRPLTEQKPLRPPVTPKKTTTEMCEDFVNEQSEQEVDFPFSL